MKVVYVTAGAAGMYCGSCMRDNTLVRALRALDVDATLVPTYTPIRTDVEDVSDVPIFFGGIGVYLAQRFPAWRRVPRIFSRALAAPGLLRLVSRFAVRNQPTELGELTLSVLRGAEGNHAREVDELCAWLAARRPDVVHLTNSLFAGLAPAISGGLGIPVVCTLQGEDLFLGGLEPSCRERAIELIHGHASSIAAFVAVSAYCRRSMSELLDVPPDVMRVVRPALPREEAAALAALPRPRPEDASPPTIGYLARICEEKGFGLLARAFIKLKTMPGMERVRLRVAGYLGPADRAFVARTARELAAAGVLEDVDVVGTVDYDGKVGFLGGVDVFSAPAVYREPKGLYVLEAFAAGLPVVLPAHGVFPELVEATGGGILVEPDDADAVADGLARLVRDHDLRAELGRRARAGVADGFSDRRMAEETLELYREVTSSRRVDAAT